MISRVAENLYWLQRYVERAAGTARLMQITGSILVEAPELPRWTPVIIVAGEQPRFLEAFGQTAQEDGEVVQRFLTWDDDCPVSLRTSIRWARENARTTRETISREVWDVLNATWLWLDSRDARRLYDRDRQGFYGRIRALSHELRGVSYATMLRDEPWAFLELGLFLERADQTARALDVKHHMLGSSEGRVETTADTVAWIATLLACTAYEPYFKRNRGSVDGPRVAGFLLLDPDFPRSVRFCLREACALLARLGTPGLPHAARDRADALLAGLDTDDIDGMLARGIHDELTAVVDGLADVSAALYGDFFDPRVPGPALEEDPQQ